MFHIADGRKDFYQWDLNRRICCYDETVEKLHFYYIKNTVLSVEKKEDEQGSYFEVPNILLQESGVIRVYAYCQDYTKTEGQFRVLKRPKPEGYIYTETEFYTVDAMVKDALTKAKENGEFDGKDGVDGQTPYIKDGYWWIGGINTNVKAVGVDGKNGTNGIDGKDGVDGKDGYTPQKGTDYYTEVEKIELVEEIKTACLGDISTALDELHAYAQALANGGVAV